MYLAGDSTHEEQFKTSYLLLLMTFVLANSEEMSIPQKLDRQIATSDLASRFRTGSGPLPAPVQEERFDLATFDQQHSFTGSMSLLHKDDELD